MFNKIKELVNRILNLNKRLDEYGKDSIVQAMPSLAYVNRAKKCIEKQEYKEAEKILEEAMELPQEDALVYKYLGIVCERTQRIHEAVVSYKKSANLDNADKDIWRLLGFALVNSNLPDEAVDAFENANKINPANTDIFAGWGMALMKLKRYPEAHEKFMESVRLNRYNFMALLFAATMEVRLNRLNDAEAKLKFLTSVSPNDANNYEYANLKYIKKDYNSAIYYAKRALEFNRNILPVYLLLAKLYAIKGDKTESYNTYEMAETQGLESPNLFFDKAVTMQMFEDFENAKLYFIKTLAILPGEEEANAGLALVNVCLGNIEDAEKLLDGIKNLKDTNYLYAKTLGLLALKKCEYKKALDYFKKVKELVFFDDMLNVCMAEACEGLEDINSAKEHYENALLSPNCTLNTYLKYSRFLIKIGEIDSAQRKLRRALKFDENNLEVLNLLFHTGYILVKENGSDYNKKETLSIADKIISIDEGAFDYPEERKALESQV